MEFKVTEAPILKSDVEVGAQIVDTMINGELTHYGTKGQKWYQRRYQNPDGSLTPAGRSRYRKMAKARAKEETESAIKSGKASFDDNGKIRSDADGDDTPKTKLPKDMTEAELRSEITKLQLRKQYNQLYNELDPPKESQVKKYAGKFMKEAVMPAATEAGKNLLKNALEEKIGQALGLSKYETKQAKKEVRDEYNELLKDMKDEKDALETMKNLYSNREWYKKTFGDKKMDETIKDDLKGSEKEKRTEAASESSTAEKVKSAGEKAGKKAKDKGEEFKEKGKIFEEAAKKVVKEVKKKKKKDKAIVYDKDGKQVGLTTFEHSSISESNIALGEAILHSMLSEELSDDELQHYGVLGMKWGVRRGDINKAYGKAMQKKQSLMDKADKFKAQSDKHKIKGGKRYITEIGRAKSEEHIRKANELEGRSLKYQKKAEKWQKKVDEVFSDVNLTKIRNDMVMKGKKALDTGMLEDNYILNKKVNEIDNFMVDRRIKKQKTRLNSNDLKNTKPYKNRFGDKKYEDMTDKERKDFDKKYESTIKDLSDKYKNAKTDKERKRILDQETLINLDYYDILDV